MHKTVVLLMALMAVTAMSAFAEVNAGIAQATVPAATQAGNLGVLSAIPQPLGTSFATIRAGTTSATSFLVAFTEVSVLIADKNTATEISLFAEKNTTVAKLATNKGSECVCAAEKVFGAPDACMASTGVLMNYV